MLQRGKILQNTSNYLTIDIEHNSSYLLPKFHKDLHNPPGRPIVLGSGGPTEKISQFVDNFIVGPLVQLSDSYIRDSTHMMYIFNKFNMSPDMLLCTLDITSLYTNIPYNEGIQSTKEFLAIYRHANTLLDNSYIVELLEVVLNNSYFDFNGKHYHQISGTALGTKLVPSNANLFMTKFEENHVYTYPLQPTLWKRFIDDIFMIWPHGMNSLLEFIKHLNTVHPTIKFTSDISNRNSFSGPYNIHQGQ